MANDRAEFGWYLAKEGWISTEPGNYPADCLLGVSLYEETPCLKSYYSFSFVKVTDTNIPELVLAILRHGLYPEYVSRWADPLPDHKVE